MASVCKTLNIESVIELNKAYPRDWLIRGRLRVFLEQSEHNKRSLLKKMGELIPQLQSRIEGGIRAMAEGFVISR